MNRFYQMNKTIQWIIALALFCLAILVLYYWFELMKLSVFSLFLVFPVTSLFQFLFAPILTLLGIYKYLSPMLLVYAANQKRYDLHNGTSFDYLFLFTNKKSGRKWQQQMLKYYLDGLLEIIKELEDGDIPKSIEIRGSSYFF